MFYAIDHLNTVEQIAFIAAYKASVEIENTHEDVFYKMDDLLSVAAVCEAGYAKPLIDEALALFDAR